MKKATSLKNMLLAGLGMMFLVFFLSSCNKDLPPSPENPDGKTAELTVTSDFDWKTSREITISVVGMKGVNPQVKNTLYVNSPAGSTYYKDLLFMNKDYSFKVTVPSTENSIVFKYGTKIKTVAISSDVVIFDYITE